MAPAPAIRTSSRDRQHAETWRSAATSGHAVSNGRADTRARLRELITAKVESLMAAALILGTGPASASAAASPAYPPVLGAFSPNGVVPGHWHLVRRAGLLYLKSGLMAGCQSAGASWQRQDGTQVRLIWAVCDAQEINLLSAPMPSRVCAFPLPGAV